MKVKFYGEPNMLIKERKRKPMSPEIVHKPVGRFDGNGEFITDNENLIEKLKKRFEYVQLDGFKCKKCDYQTENRGDLMAHYRKEHPKEG